MNAQLPVRMTRVVPARHMNRWYQVSIMPSLFDPFGVLCEWGSLRSTYRRTRYIPALSLDQARKTAAQIIQRKHHRGYQ